MTERKEHLAWCKQRATEYLDRGDLTNAITSMASDMGKREDTNIPAPLIMLGVLALNDGPDAVRRWIDGFN